MLNVTPDLESLFQRAQRHHQAGQLPQAEALYRQILQLEPLHAPSLYLLGTLAAQTGRPDQALELIRNAITLQPQFPDAYNNLGGILLLQGQLDAALAAFRQALAQQPDHAEACVNLGQVLQEKGQFEASADACRRALELNPHSPLAHNNLGNALRELGQTDRAIAAYRQAIALRPDFADAYNNLGNVFSAIHQVAEAIAAYRQAVAMSPDLAVIRHNLANALREAGDYDEALAAYRQALTLRPDYPEAWLNLAGMLMELGELDQALASCRRALALCPDHAAVHSGLLGILHYHPGYEPQTITQEHRTWAGQHALPLKRLISPHSHDRDPERRLKIGYVSPDFRCHAVAPMVLPLIQHHDRAGFEVYCYAQVVKPDAMTQRFQKHADHWRDTVGLRDDQVAEQVRQDRIDILVDLAGHTAGNRLLVFAQKPAPVQVTRQGYPGTTGLDTIDYRMTDAYADPPGLADRLHTERLIRLPQTNWLYQPPPEEASIPVGPLPVHVPLTFGCFNSFAKVTDPMLHLWARILTAVPGSKLLLKARVLAAPSVQHRVQALFASHGLSPDRLQLVPWCPTTADHLQLYNRLTIALDPFPYHGTTTTCEALWMGVPVITLAGQTHVSRVGVSLLTNLGTPELIAQSPDDYLRIAVELAADRPRLAHLHATLRQKLQASPIMDYPRFARNIENAYREMWRTWCSPPPIGVGKAD